MNIYFLFSGANNEYICKYIYTNESKKIFSYSYDEGYIVKSEENSIKSLKQIEEKYPAKPAGQKAAGKGLPPVLMQKEFFDVKQALFFLNGTLDNFNNGVPSRKRLPEIINPYDFDFDHEEDLGSMDEHGFGSEKAPGGAVDRDDYDDKPVKDDFDSNDEDDDAYYTSHEHFDDQDLDDHESFSHEHFDDDDDD